MRELLTSLPVMRLSVGGQPLVGAAAAAVVEVRVLQKLSLPDQCEITFAREALPPGFHADLGQTLELALSEDTLFDGEITAITHDYMLDRGDLLRVRAYHCLHRLQRKQSARVFSSISIAGLARKLTAELSINVVGPDEDLETTHVAQCAQTDLQLLAHGAAAAGYFFHCKNGQLTFVTLAGTQSSLELELGHNLHRVRIEVNGRRAAQSVSVRGWNPTTGRVHRGDADNARGGAEISLQLSASESTPGSERMFLAGLLESDAAAKAKAQARLDRQAHEAVQVWGITDGDAVLCPGLAVRIEGVATEVKGRYTLTEVVHRITAEEGYICEFWNRLDEEPASEGFQCATLARVSRIDDPHKLGRVQVAYLAADEMPSDWLQVLVPGAGASKGMLMLPDVGDLVLVLSLEHLGQGIVVGGLFGSDAPRDSGIAGGKRRRFRFGTSQGNAVEFDDAQRRAVFRDGAGNRLEFTSGRVRLHAVADLEISAPGKRITLAADSIDFKKA